MDAAATGTLLDRLLNAWEAATVGSASAAAEADMAARSGDDLEAEQAPAFAFVEDAAGAVVGASGEAATGAAVSAAVEAAGAAAGPAMALPFEADGPAVSAEAVGCAAEGAFPGAACSGVEVVTGTGGKLLPGGISIILFTSLAMPSLSWATLAGRAPPLVSGQ